MQSHSYFRLKLWPQKSTKSQNQEATHLLLAAFLPLIKLVIGETVVLHSANVCSPDTCKRARSLPLRCTSPSGSLLLFDVPTQRAPGPSDKALPDLKAGAPGILPVRLVHLRTD